MIEDSLSTLTSEEVAEPDIRVLEHTLASAERLNATAVPLLRLRNMDEDTYEEIVQVWSYMCLKAAGKYPHVHQVGGSGDKGSDVIAYLDDTFNKFDLYQCKHYKGELTYSNLYGEIGKLLTYTYKKTYPVPQHYYIASPYGLAQSFRDLLHNVIENRYPMYNSVYAIKDFIETNRFFFTNSTYVKINNYFKLARDLSGALEAIVMAIYSAEDQDAITSVYDLTYEQDIHCNAQFVREMMTAFKTADDCYAYEDFAEKYEIHEEVRKEILELIDSKRDVAI